MTAPVAALTILGVLIAALGLFAAGSLEVAVVGLLAVFGAGVLEVLESRHKRDGVN